LIMQIGRLYFIISSPISFKSGRELFQGILRRMTSRILLIRVKMSLQGKFKSASRDTHACLCSRSCSFPKRRGFRRLLGLQLVLQAFRKVEHNRQRKLADTHPIWLDCMKHKQPAKQELKH
jgi:hypothetical protein